MLLQNRERGRLFKQNKTKKTLQEKKLFRTKRQIFQIEIAN